MAQRAQLLAVSFSNRENIPLAPLPAFSASHPPVIGVRDRVQAEKERGDRFYRQLRNERRVANRASAKKVELLRTLKDLDEEAG